MLLAELSFGQNAVIGFGAAVVGGIITALVTFGQNRESKLLHLRALRHAEHQRRRAEQERRAARWEPLALHLLTKRFDLFSKMYQDCMELMLAASYVINETDAVVRATNNAAYWAHRKQVSDAVTSNSFLMSLSVSAAIMQFVMLTGNVIDAQPNEEGILGMQQQFDVLSLVLRQSLGADSIDKIIQSDFISGIRPATA